MKIAFVTGNYPSRARPFEGAFVRQIVHAMARQGNECIVIKPTSVFDARYGRLPRYFSIEDVHGVETKVKVYRPRYVSFSSRKLGRFHTGRLTQLSFNAAVLESFKKNRIRPDIVYGHFLYQAGYSAVVSGRHVGVPSVIGVGEGTFWTVEPFGFKRARQDFSDASGYIAVGTHVKNGLIKYLDASPEKILLAPNGVDLSKFRPMDRKDTRAKLGIAPGLFVIIFVGAFDDLKGGKELVDATDVLDGVGLVMLGTGHIDLSSRNIIYKGHVQHDEVPLFLNAGDIFVLPTKEEGSCNSVIEAMACGLPIVTSNGDYMDDIVDDNVAIRVKPTDVEGIRAAIVELKGNHGLRRRMSESCLKRSRKFDIDKRAERITRWMGKIVEEYRSSGR